MRQIQNTFVSYIGRCLEIVRRKREVNHLLLRLWRQLIIVLRWSVSLISSLHQVCSTPVLNFFTLYGTSSRNLSTRQKAIRKEGRIRHWRRTQSNFLCRFQIHSESVAHYSGPLIDTIYLLHSMNNVHFVFIGILRNSSLLNVLLVHISQSAHYYPHYLGNLRIRFQIILFSFSLFFIFIFTFFSFAISTIRS